MAWVSQVNLRRARLDGENDSFFSLAKLAGRKDYLLVFWVSGVCFVAGVYLSVSGNQSWFALLALIVATAALAMQMTSTDVFWRRSVANPDH